MNPVHYQDKTHKITREPCPILWVSSDTRDFLGEVRGAAMLCDLTPGNAAVVRSRLPWLNSRPMGTTTSFGFSERLGLATAGHIRSVQGSGIAPMFAQQSVRQNSRTGRTPQDVLDDAMWTVFELD